jgi:hypothetical protein
MKAADPVRFAELDQTRFASTLSPKKKRRLAEVALPGDQLLPSSPSSASDRDRSWSFSGEEDSDDCADFRPVAAGVGGLGDLPGRSFFPGSIPPIHESGRSLPAPRSLLKEGPGAGPSPSKRVKAHGDLSRKGPRYPLSSAPSPAGAISEPPLSGSPSLRTVGPAAGPSRANKQRPSPLTQSDKHRQPHFPQPGTHLSSSTSRSVPASASANLHSPRTSSAPGSQAATGGAGGPSPQSLEDYIRFSVLVSLSQQDVTAQHAPLSAPLPPPADADGRFLAHGGPGPSFGPHEGLLLSSGAPTHGLLNSGASRGNIVLPSPTGISSTSRVSSPPPPQPPSTSAPPSKAN